MQEEKRAGPASALKAPDPLGWSKSAPQEQENPQHQTVPPRRRAVPGKGRVQWRGRLPSNRGSDPTPAQQLLQPPNHRRVRVGSRRQHPQRGSRRN
jgi:hypothetical protein